MRSVFQRVKSASVDILDGEKYRSGEIGKGAMILVAVENGDTDDDAKWLANKMAGMRVYEDADGKMNLSLKDVGGDALVVSQFTLFGNMRKGMRPSFNRSAHPDISIPPPNKKRMLSTSILFLLSESFSVTACLRSRSRRR